MSAVEASGKDEIPAVLDLIVAICVYYRELLRESAGI